MMLDSMSVPSHEDNLKYSINGRIEWIKDELLKTIKIAKSRKVTRDYTSEDDYLVHLENNISGNGSKRK